MSQSDDSLSRAPPAGVRRELRREEGCGCPVSNRGNPYLEYHHLDPREQRNTITIRFV
jgi:hypothetical protein